MHPTTNLGSLFIRDLFKSNSLFDNAPKNLVGCVNQKRIDTDFILILNIIILVTDCI